MARLLNYSPTESTLGFSLYSTLVAKYIAHTPVECVFCLWHNYVILCTLTMYSLSAIIQRHMEKEGMEELKLELQCTYIPQLPISVRSTTNH